jgi:hypothetical protein
MIVSSSEADPQLPVERGTTTERIDELLSNRDLDQRLGLDIAPQMLIHGADSHAGAMNQTAQHDVGGPTEGKTTTMKPKRPTGFDLGRLNTVYLEQREVVISAACA